MIIKKIEIQNFRIFYGLNTFELSDGKKDLDYERLKTMCATLYRIEKRRPFDAKKLGTLQTIVTRIL